LGKIFTCDPAPAEVLVHIDAGDDETAPMLEREFAGRVTWFQSKTPQGPGGGRNLLLRRAKYSLVASFDDDSWPLEVDYFATVAKLMATNPRAAVFTGRVTLRGERPQAAVIAVWPVASFEGCACVYRREAFLATRGFMPLRHAYGMEEVDVALQLMDAGWDILRAPALKIYHDTELEHHVSPKINAAHITNTALLTYLRYPLLFWPLGVFQVLNRVRYAMAMKRWRGIIQGLISIPTTCWKYRIYRKQITAATLRISRQLARNKFKK